MIEEFLVDIDTETENRLGNFRVSDVPTRILIFLLNTGTLSGHTDQIYNCP